MYHPQPIQSLAKPARACVVLQLMAFCIAGSARANLITNGTFDSNANGWTTSGGGFQTIIGNPAGSFQLNASGAATSDPYVQQTVNGLNPGQTYTLSWQLLHNFGTQTSPSFGAFLDPAAAGSDPNPNGLALVLLGYAGPYTSKPWVSHQVSFVATAISHTIRFAAELDTRTTGIAINTDVSYFIDNVSLIGVPLAGNPVPEPGTVLLLGAGLSAVLWMRRRKVLAR